MSLALNEYTEDKIQLLKNTICRGSDSNEFELFLHACKRTGLDPFMRQIYAVKRWDSGMKKEVMTIQVGIDGYRLIATRTGKYARPEKPTLFEWEDEAKKILKSATVYFKQLTSDGTWHEFCSTAFFSEYCAYYIDKETKNKVPMAMWAKMPMTMLEKCAEAKGLRQAFPAELSGLYTKEEMEQADNPKISDIEVKEVPLYDAARDDNAIDAFIDASGFNDRESVKTYLLKYANHYKQNIPEVLDYYGNSKEKFDSNYHAWIVKNNT